VHVGILHRRVIARGSFTSTDDLRDKLYEHMVWHNVTDQPFRWTYRPRSWGAGIGRTSDRRN